jgi:hypothetical protein
VALVTAEALVKSTQYDVEAESAVTLLIVTVLLEPAAVMLPGNAVAPVSAAHEAEETVCVALTEPLALAQPAVKLTLTDVAPALAVVKTNLKDVVVPADNLFSLT